MSPIVIPTRRKLFLFPGALAAVSLARPFMAAAAAPEVGSEQWDIMKDYAGFVKKMHLYNKEGGSRQWCCNLADGRARLKETVIPSPDGDPDKTSYLVIATRKAFGKALPADEVPILITPDKVLRVADAKRACEEAGQLKTRTTEVTVADEADSGEAKELTFHEKLTACTPPPFNILWISNSSVQANTANGVFCYWPIPNVG